MSRETPDTLSQFDKVIARCKQTFMDKYYDYGASWALFRLPSLTDQIYIKAERIRSIETSGENRVGDPIESEYAGIINYCIIAQILLEIRDQYAGVLPAEWDNGRTLSDKYDTWATATRSVLAQKNADYGEAWRNMRPTSFTDMILVKLRRLRQIEDHAGETRVSEKESGHYMDILNYAVFALIRRNWI